MTDSGQRFDSFLAGVFARPLDVGHERPLMLARIDFSIEQVIATDHECAVVTVNVKTTDELGDCRFNQQFVVLCGDTIGLRFGVRNSNSTEG